MSIATGYSNGYTRVNSNSDWEDYYSCYMGGFGDRVRTRREELDMSQEELATKAGIRQATISNIESGRNAGSKHSASLAAALRCRALWLSTGKGPRELGEVDGFQGVNVVPIVSPISAGRFGETSDVYPPGVREDTPTTFTTKDVGPNGFALRVKGDSMTATSGGKTFPEGCLVIVDPRKLDPIDRQIIVARLKGHDAATIKQFRRDDVGRVWLQPLNPQHNRIDDEFVVLGTVVQKVEDV